MEQRLNQDRGRVDERKEKRCSNELVESVITNQTQIIECRAN